MTVRVIYIETTGTDPTTDAIVEIASVEGSNELRDEVKFSARHWLSERADCTRSPT
jgi:DNA polymerase III epsilon subunit-like protein